MENSEKIHASKIRQILEKRDSRGPVPFAIEFVKKSTGEIEVYPQAILTSVHSKGATINILKVGESTPKKIRKCLILKINGLKVYY